MKAKKMLSGLTSLALSLSAFAGIGAADAIRPTEAKAAYDETEEIQRYILYSAEELAKIAQEKEERENKEAKLNSLYNADMTFSDVVDAVAGLLYGGAE